VVSAAATEITTRLFEETADTTAIGHAEALRRSMLALMETADKSTMRISCSGPPMRHRGLTQFLCRSEVPS
jgi:hypothetical protein